MLSKRMPLLLALLAAMLPLSGCWDRMESNDIAIVLSSALDKEPNGLYRMTVQIPLPGQMGGPGGGGGGTGGDKSYYMDSATGRTIREIIAELQRRMPRWMFFAHRRTFIISEHIARNEGIRGLFDPLSRPPENRMTTYLIISKGPAYSLLNAKPKTERFSSEAVRELVKAPTVIPQNIKRAGAAIAEEGIDPVIVYMGAKKSENESEASDQIQVLGYAQFRDGKMVGTFEDDAAQTLGMLFGAIDRAVLHVPHNGSIVDVRLVNVRTRIKPFIKGDRALFRITVDAAARVEETKPTVETNRPISGARVEQSISEVLRNDFNRTIRLIQERQADSVGFGSRLYRAYPDEWERRFSKNWGQSLQDAEFEVTVNTRMTVTGALSQNITVYNKER